MTTRFLFLFIGLGLALAGCSTTPAAPPHEPLKVVDLTDDFAAFHAESASLQGKARAEALKAYFAPRIAGFYSNERVKAADYDDRILAALDKWPEQRADIEAVSRQFAALLAPAQRRFEAEFGPMRGYPPIFLVHSLGEFDGGMRSLPEGRRLMFGADVIARVHKGHSVAPFFHHELFHLYHSQTFSGCKGLYCAVWGEGLAVYVASRLNPQASDAELLLSFPVSLREAVERDRTKALCGVLAKMHSTAPEDYAPLFQGRPQNGAVLPPRYGYYVGYLVAEEAGRTRSLKELARIPAAEVGPIVEASLRRLADC